MRSVSQSWGSDEAIIDTNTYYPHLTLTESQCEAIYRHFHTGDRDWYNLPHPDRNAAIRMIQHTFKVGAIFQMGAKDDKGPTPLPPESVAAPTSEEEWHRERIFARVAEVRRRRYEQYNAKAQSSIANNFDSVGAVWSGLLSSWLGQAIPPIPGWLFSLLMAALKIVRVTWAPHEDSYIDAINYTALAEELHHGPTEARAGDTCGRKDRRADT